VKFIIDDERHAERQGEYQDFDQALAELKRRAKIPWNQPPNVAPCTGWRTCGRMYEVVEYDDSETPWKQLRRTLVLEVSASGVKWAVATTDISNGLH
jgi:hypothetical protein